MALTPVPNIAGGGGSGITQLTGDVTAGPGSGSVVATLANIPNQTPAAGAIAFAQIVTPGIPVAGAVVYVDASGALYARANTTGTRSHTAQTKAAVASNFLTAMDAAGAFTAAQPAFTDLSGSLGVAQFPAVTGDVTIPAGSTVSTLANIPNDVPAAGDILFTQTAAPANPAAGKARVWIDSTSNQLRVRISTGVSGTTSPGVAAVASQFLTGMSNSGIFSQAQPAFTDISGTLGAAQFPALTGAITTPGGSLATSVGTIPGRLLRAPQVLTTGTTITHPTGTTTIVVYGVGGGGAGGGVNAAAQAIGACGGSGTYGQRTFTSAAASSTFAIGGAGAGSSGAAGGNGGSSTWTNNATTLTLPGGSGGGVAAGAAAIKVATGGAGGGAATNADFSINGQAGADAVNTTAPIISLHSGAGGSNPMGSGGAGNVSIATVVAGNAGTGFGAGGSGALNGTTAVASAGAAGTAGAFIVWEFS